MKNRLLSLSSLLLLTGLLALAGCGDDQADEKPAEEAAQSEAAPAADDAADTQAAAGDSGSETATDDQADDSSTAAAEESTAAASDSASQAGGGETHTVTARATAYDPAIIKIQPGDKVSWTNMSGHNVHFESKLIPDGAESYQSPLGDNINRTFDKEGLYLYKCDPHFAMGMVGAIIVGKVDNLAKIEENAYGMYKRVLIKAKKEIE